MTRRIIVLAVAAYLVLVFIDQFVLVELFLRRAALPLLSAAATAVACIGAGYLVRRRARGWATNLAVGYPIFGAACFLVGTLKIAAWTMVPIVVVFAVFGLFSLDRAAERRVPPIAIALVMLCGFVAAQAPPNTLDELAYHLAVPWTWAKEGRAIDLPLISHSYFPLGVESADLPLFAVLGIDGGIASHFLHLTVAAAAAALLMSGDGLIAAAIVTAPVLAITAGWSLVDWNLLAIVLVLLRAAEQDDSVTLSAALAAGLLTKYTFLPIALIVLIAARRKPGATALVGSIFFIRNAVLTGNPFAPFFGALAPHVANYRSGASLSSYVFDGRFLDESLGASLWATAVATVGTIPWMLFGAGVVLCLLAPSARIVAPFFAAAASRASLAWRPARYVIAAAIVLQLFMLAYFVDRSGVFAVLGGRESDEDFLTKNRASYASIAAIDTALPSESRTLVIGLGETFWFRHRVRGGGNFDGPRMSAYLQTATAEALREKFRRDGITHVAVFSVPVPTTVEKKAEERDAALTAGAQHSLAQLLDRYAANVAQRGSAALFTLR